LTRALQVGLNATGSVLPRRAQIKCPSPGRFLHGRGFSLRLGLEMRVHLVEATKDDQTEYWAEATHREDAIAAVRSQVHPDWKLVLTERRLALTMRRNTVRKLGQLCVPAHPRAQTPAGYTTMATTAPRTSASSCAGGCASCNPKDLFLGEGARFLVEQLKRRQAHIHDFHLAERGRLSGRHGHCGGC
jgi:hypothetical protein